jgi:hypothetical protein
MLASIYISVLLFNNSGMTREYTAYTLGNIGRGIQALIVDAQEAMMTVPMPSLAR